MAVQTRLITFTAEGQDFLIQPNPAGQISSFQTSSIRQWPSACVLDFLLATVISWDKSHFTKDDLEHVKADFAARDDVWVGSFMKVIVFRAPKSPVIELDEDQTITYVDSVTTRPFHGPVALQPSTGKIYEVWRLFDDTYGAFVGGAVRHNTRTQNFEWLSIENQIAVPSKLYFERTSCKPLAGLRFAVKDLIDVDGLETGCGSRSYRDLYPKKTVSAPCIEQLLDAGAVLVGKTKTSQFADGQVPSQWFDYIAPFNPRGDTYQNPSSSSTGSAVASAGYTWLDFVIGTDSGGSIRDPAGRNGTYGARPSLNAVASRGFQLCPFLDTVGVFARSASVLEVASSIIADPLYQLTPWPGGQRKFKLLYPVRAQNTETDGSLPCFLQPSHSSGEMTAEVQFESIVQKLEKHLGCTRQAFNFDDLWRETCPAGQSNDLHAATGKIYQVLGYFEYIKHTIDPFIADYQAIHNGRKPFIEPLVLARQAYGRKITPSEYTEAIESLQKFSQWILNILFATSSPAEIPILIIPQSQGRPDYRDTVQASDAPLFWSHFSMYSISYCSGCPDFTVPIGEVPYHSRITDREEWLPLSLAVLSRPGMDAVLLRLLREMEAEGALRPPAAGARMYPDA